MGDPAKFPGRTIGYIRVSTEDQADFGSSLDAQRVRITAYAKANGLELVEVIEGAGESAKTLDRPGLQRALELLRGADVLLIPTLDRLTRTVRDWNALLEEHFADRRLLSAGEHVDVVTAGGRFILNILFAKAEFERDQIGERTSAALQHKVSQGEYTGGTVPYGYRLVPAETEDGADHIEQEPGEQAVIAAARELRTTGLALHKVGKQLAERGYLSRAGKVFAAGQVQRMLTE